MMSELYWVWTKDPINFGIPSDSSEGTQKTGIGTEVQFEYDDSNGLFWIGFQSVEDFQANI